VTHDVTLGTHGAGRCADCGSHSPGRWPGDRCYPCWQAAVAERNTRVEAGPTALYRLFTSDGYLLYVGISVDPKRRFKEHHRAEWWPEVDTARTVIEWLDCGGHEAERIELAAIRAEFPWHNRQGMGLDGEQLWELPEGSPPPPVFVDYEAWTDWRRVWALWWAAARDGVLNREERAALGR
jgi:hypothetical protein